MACLAMSLLGTFEVTLAGVPVTTFGYDKVRALLAYLAVEADRPHRRDTLTGLFWPERPERQARQNLSQALLKLRQALGDRQARPPYLLITPQTLQFNRSGDYELDVTAFSSLLEACRAHDHSRLAGCHSCLKRLQRAVALYRGDFLAGFALNDSPAFEEWALLRRERLQQLAVDALHHLVLAYQAQGDDEAALPYARRRLELDPWREDACRELMRLLARSDQRAAALTQYETYRQQLWAELGLEPPAATTRLYEQIRTGKISGAAGARENRGESFTPAPEQSLPVGLQPTTPPPPFPCTTIPPPPPSPPVCVAREEALAQLNHFLEAALAGQGRVIFVTGGPGWGKTTLLRAFARRAQAAQTELVVAGVDGTAHAGRGDPYLPFRELLGLLTGDVEAGYAAGSISREQASRLWRLLPLAVQTLLEVGPALIGTFLAGAGLLQRAERSGPWPAGAEWLARLEEVVARQMTNPGEPNPHQGTLFEQYSQVLQALARRQPLLLLLDDLQWSDPSSLDLLFHLGRRLEGSRILVVGAYRPAEVALGYPGPPHPLGETGGERERHPLESLVNEFKRFFGDIELDLSQGDHRHFVDALLDTEPNRLDGAFRQALYRQTGGQPLFTVELLRAMQARGDLVRDPEGRWLEGPALDWETLPARVEAVMAERLGRLPALLESILTVASVEGETFTAEVVAWVRGLDELKTVYCLNHELERRHRLVSAQKVRQLGPDGQRLSRYRFRHRLFQKYLYRQLDPAKRAYLHQAVGTALEELYGERAVEIAGPLAHHFQAAGLVEKAAHYLDQSANQSKELARG